MKLISRIFQLTLLYKIISLFKWIYQYIKDYGYVADTLYSHEFNLVLKKYLNVEFSTDWLGRLYGVINPSIDVNGKLDFTNMIIELNDDLTNNNTYVKHWVYRQLSMVSALYKLENSGFFDIIGVEFRHVGPQNADNYLVIFDIVSRKEMTSFLKSTLIHASIYALVGFAIFMIV